MLKHNCRISSRSRYSIFFQASISSLQFSRRATTFELRFPRSSFDKLLPPQFTSKASRTTVATMSTRNSIPPDTLSSFLSAMSSIYGPLNLPADANWTPPDLSDDCHKGRYLWTDAFGVVNFVTLYMETSDASYLTYAERLVSSVHEILGKTRDGSKWLGDELDGGGGGGGGGVLAGGLRIGKAEDTGDDRDGQYWHYIVLWMFALLRLHSASHKPVYATQARKLGAAMYKGFVLNVPGPTLKERPRIPWKISTDGKSTLVNSEGNLDPYDGLVIFSKLQKLNIAGEEEEETEICINKGYEYCRRRVESKWRDFHSSDPLDLGMALWTSSWADEDWAGMVGEKSIEGVMYLNRQNYFTNPTRRLAFREFGTAMGLQCAASPAGDRILIDIVKDIVSFWQVRGLASAASGLTSINTVMYAAALWPGAFRRGFFDTD